RARRAGAPPGRHRSDRPRRGVSRRTRVRLLAVARGAVALVEDRSRVRARHGCTVSHAAARRLAQGRVARGRLGVTPYNRGMLRRFFPVAFITLAASALGAQERTVPVPPNVTVQGLPAIPQSIADDLAQYADFRSADFLAWHPTERRMLIKTTFGNVPQIHVVDRPGGAPA